jgi:hypothetical protein
VLAGRLAASVAARQLLELTMIPKNQLSKAHE